MKNNNLLHYAFSKVLSLGNNKEIENFVVATADVNVRGNDEWTLLHIAVQYCNEKAINLLIDKGAEVNAQNKDGRTSLHNAAFAGYLNVLELLIIKGGDVDFGDKDNYTALHFAAEVGHTDIVNLLLRKKASVDIQDDYGCTPLYVAVYKDNVSVAELLIKSGADINAKSTDGSTPLDMAHKGFHEDIIKLFKNHRGYVNGKYVPTHLVNNHKYVPTHLVNNHKELHKPDYAKKNPYMKYTFTITLFCITSAFFFTSTFLAMCLFVVAFTSVGFLYYETCEYQKKSNTITYASQPILEQALMKETHWPVK